MAFFQSCWDVIGLDVIKVFLEFHQRGKFEKSFNATFITLIPKKVRVVEVKNFRHLQNYYKDLANKLKSVLEIIISNTQNAFLRGR